MDTAASGSGTNPEGAAGGNETLRTLPATLGVAAGKPAGTSGGLNRSDAIQVFLAAPLLPEPTSLTTDHVTAVLALAIV